MGGPGRFEVLAGAHAGDNRCGGSDLSGQQRRRRVAAGGDRVRIAARGAQHERTLVDEVHAATPFDLAGQVVEQGPHPRLLRPDHRDRRVVLRTRSAAELGVGVDEGAAAVLGPHPRLQGREHGQHRVPPALGQPGGEVLAPAVRPAQQVQRDEGVLGAEPVVERLLRGPGGVGDEVDAHGPDSAVVEELGGRREQSVAGLGQRRQRREHGPQRGGVASSRTVGDGHGTSSWVHCEYTDRMVTCPPCPPPRTPEPSAEPPWSSSGARGSSAPSSEPRTPPPARSWPGAAS